MGILSSWFEKNFGKAEKPVFSFGEKQADGFAPVLKDGKVTNCRMYLWDREEVEMLSALARKIQNKKVS